MGSKKEINVVNSMLVTMIIFCLLAIGTSCLNPTKKTTQEEIYGSICDYYSIVNDREDITSGEFRLWPQNGDKIGFTTTLTKLKLKSSVDKEIGNGEIKIKTDYKTSGSIAKDSGLIKVKMESGEVAEVMVAFEMTFNQGVDGETFKKLQDLKSQLGEELTTPVEVVCIIDNPCEDFGLWLDYRVMYNDPPRPNHWAYIYKMPQTYVRLNHHYYRLTNMTSIAEDFLRGKKTDATIGRLKKQQGVTLSGMGSPWVCIGNGTYFNAMPYYEAMSETPLSELKENPIGTVEIEVRLKSINGIKL